MISSRWLLRLCAAPLTCAAVATAGAQATAHDERARPEPFGLLENQDLAFCSKTSSRPPGEECVCSASAVETSMTFDEFIAHLHVGAEDPALVRSIDNKLEQWARYCGRRVGIARANR